jgi:hypothetical protein
MGLLKRLSGLLSPAGRSSEKREGGVYWVFVQCNRCGEQLRARVNMFNDLSINYGEQEGDTTYFCRKTLIGNQQCFQRIEVELTFDSQRHLLDRQISGGKFITEAEYSQ